MELVDRPVGYRGPNLDPTQLRLRPRRLAEGVYALVASPAPRDNGGCIIGSRGALVVDAGMNGEAARRIQATVRSLTDKPILYLVNTNYHGDHTFGNYAFPAATEIVSSCRTRESMTDLEAEKQFRSRNLNGNVTALDDVVDWRLPDTVFDKNMEIDLGGRKVQLWHFGAGNTPGDTVVYSPDAKAAWTGNLIGNERVLPMLLEGGPGPYLETLDRFEHTLDVKTIVPGHGPFGSQGSFTSMKKYLWELTQEVGRAVSIGLTEQATVAAVALDPKRRIPLWNPMSRLNPLLENLHRLNVLATYRAMKSEEREQHASRLAAELVPAGF